MQMLAIAGSLRAGSYNRQLAEAARAVMAQRRPDIGFEVLDWADVPFMNQDIEHPEPGPVARVREAVRAADGVWLFSPEYNHAVPGPLKNLIDWLSRPAGEGEPQVLARKPIALAGASIGMSGAAHAQEQLVSLLSFLDARVMNKPRLTIPHVGTQAPGGVLALDESLPHLESQADAFAAFIERNAPSS